MNDCEWVSDRQFSFLRTPLNVKRIVKNANRKFKKIFIVSDGRHPNPDTFRTPYFLYESTEISELAHRNRIFLKPLSREWIFYNFLVRDEEV